LGCFRFAGRRLLSATARGPLDGGWPARCQAVGELIDVSRQLAAVVAQLLRDQRAVEQRQRLRELGLLAAFAVANGFARGLARRP
jgi:hypothetical protein